MRATLFVYFQLALINIFPNEVDTLRLLFLGDIMQHKGELEAALIKGENRNDPRSYDYSGYFENLKARFAEVDMRIANMETTFAKPPYSGYPTFCSPQTLLTESKKGGIDLFLTANNHICDKGKKGLTATMNLYDSLKVLYTGIYRDSLDEVSKNPLVVELKGFRIAFLNYTYGTNGIHVPAPFIVKLIDTNSIKTDLMRAKATNSDFIIACLHWGDEYILKHNAYQERIERFFYANGADIIIGSHPHVAQDTNVEYGLNGEITHITVYSLGNAIANMTASITRKGMMAEIILSKDGYGSKRILAPKFEYIWTSIPKQLNRNFTILPLLEK